MALAARAGDRIVARFAEPATAFVVDVAPFGAVACLPDRPEPLWTLEWQDDGDGWWSFAAPVTGPLGLRVRSPGGHRAGDWRSVPAADATPPPPQVTAAVDGDGRVTLWFGADTTARVEARAGESAPWVDLGPRRGPALPGGIWPPGAAPSWRLRAFARTATGPTLSSPVVIDVPVDSGRP